MARGCHSVADWLLCGAVLQALHVTRRNDRGRWFITWQGSGQKGRIRCQDQPVQLETTHAIAKCKRVVKMSTGRWIGSALPKERDVLYPYTAKWSRKVPLADEGQVQAGEGQLQFHHHERRWWGPSPQARLPASTFEASGCFCGSPPLRLVVIFPCKYRRLF